MFFIYMYMHSQMVVISHCAHHLSVTIYFFKLLLIRKVR